MNAAQCKMARAATDLGVRDLAERAGVSPNTIARLERGEVLKPATVEAIRAALEAAGVEFMEDGERTGVLIRLKWSDNDIPDDLIAPPKP